MTGAAFGWMDRHPGKSGALTGWIQQAVSAGVAILLVPVLTKFLSDSESGLWFAFQGLVAIASLANFGIGQVVARQTAYCIGSSTSGDKHDFLDFGRGADGVRSLDHYASVVYLVVLGLAVLIGVVTFELVIPHTKLLPGAVSEFRPIWFLMLGAGLSLIVATRYAAYLIGSGRTHIFKILAILYSVTQGSGLFFVVWKWQSLLLMGATSFACSLCYAAVMYASAKRLVVGVGVRNKECRTDKVVLNKLIKISFPLGVVNIGAYLFSNIQVPLIGALLGPALVTPYYLVQKVAQFVMLGCQQSLQPQMPKFTRLIAAQEAMATLQLTKRTVLVYGGLVVSAAVVFTVGAPLALKWMAGGSEGVPMSVIFLMAVDLFVFTLSVGLSHLVIASGRNPFMWPTLIGGVLNLVLIYLLVPHFGLLTLPLATLVSGLLTTYRAGFFNGWKLWVDLRNQAQAVSP